jgi:hypothetical protein
VTQLIATLNISGCWIRMSGGFKYGVWQNHILKPACHSAPLSAMPGRPHT